MSQLRARLEHVALVATLTLATAWATTFAWLAVARYLGGGAHAEDVGFTDQVLANLLRGQWFRMSIYAQDPGGSWNTELDLSRIARPDSLLAFHVEPMLLLLVPIYALGGGILALLIVQAVALAAGAIPAYRLGRHASRSDFGGLAVAAAYLLSPLGQWAVLADFHTSTLAAPLLLLAVERLVVGRSPNQAVLAAGTALLAREDVGPTVALLGVVAIVRTRTRGPGLVLLALGLGWSILAGLLIRTYSGGFSPFEVRYGPTLGGGFESTVQALVRPTVVGYVQTLLLSGGWLALFAPLALLPAIPGVALNALSTSSWMAAGKAHYSGLVLPIVTMAAASALGTLRRRPRLLPYTACAGLMLTSALGYFQEGAGPLGGNYAPAAITGHDVRAAQIATSLPSDAAVSASSALVPRVSGRPRVYVFPAVLDADYIFLDLKASPAPTSAGDVYLRVQDLLAYGGWHLETADDGLVLLRRDPDAAPNKVAQDDDARARASADPRRAVSLVSAMVVPSPDGAVDIDGPHWILRTVWRTDQPLPRGTRLEITIDLEDGEQLHRWDIAELWWNAPTQWAPGAAVTVDVPDVPIRKFKSWRATWSTS